MEMLAMCVLGKQQLLYTFNSYSKNGRVHYILTNSKAIEQSFEIIFHAMIHTYKIHWVFHVVISIENAFN